jgi:hypothetical protein
LVKSKKKRKERQKNAKIQAPLYILKIGVWIINVPRVTWVKIGAQLFPWQRWPLVCLGSAPLSLKPFQGWNPKRAHQKSAFLHIERTFTW